MIQGPVSQVDLTQLISIQVRRLKTEAKKRELKLRKIADKMRTLTTEWESLLQDAFEVKVKKPLTNMSGVVTEKRKPGRPRKVVQEPTVMATITPEPVFEEAQPKKRPSITMEKILDETFNHEILEGKEEVNLNTPMYKKPRGRTKKVKDETTEAPKTITRKKQV